MRGPRSCRRAACCSLLSLLRKHSAKTQTVPFSSPSTIKADRQSCKNQTVPSSGHRCWAAARAGATGAGQAGRVGTRAAWLPPPCRRFPPHSVCVPGRNSTGGWLADDPQRVPPRPRACGGWCWVWCTGARAQLLRPRRATSGRLLSPAIKKKGRRNNHRTQPLTWGIASYLVHAFGTVSLPFGSICHAHLR